ncbi:N-acetylmuramoyl-L-alanine amidase family protein [Otoolea muris]|uniref:N-acetylmuramoyl-L-alanine amidase family protein n=1 Tax=Otoolea muris TaxID=2941515 RepID=UPI00203E03E3|nr:N-acetylmuramoyl-L-alanine amidase family protein [Otoolea muris]
MKKRGNVAAFSRRICVSLALAACFLASGGTGTHIDTYAAESSVIESVSITFKSTYGEPEEIIDPEITAGGGSYSIGDIQYRTEYEKWKPGKKVRVEITLVAEDGKYFPVSLNRSKCKVSGAEYVSAKALDDSSLQVKVDYKPVTVLGTTEKAGWSSRSKKKASWKSVSDAPGYTLTLYGDDKVVKRLNVETNSADLSEYMTDLDKTYYYEVKAVPITSEQKKYLKEGAYVTSTDQEFDWDDYQREEARTQTPGDGGAVKGDSYVLPDGSRAVNSWKKIGETWYYFDGAGNKAKGWVLDGPTWYYMDQNGAMQTGWLDLGNGAKFFLNSDGAMLTGWIQPAPGTWYYMNQDGYMQIGWIQVDGKSYYLNGDGTMAFNTTVDGRPLGPDGAALQ